MQMFDLKIKTKISLFYLNDEILFIFFLNEKNI